MKVRNICSRTAERRKSGAPTIPRSITLHPSGIQYTLGRLKKELSSASFSPKTTPKSPSETKRWLTRTSAAAALAKFPAKLETLPSSVSVVPQIPHSCEISFYNNLY